MRSRRPRPARTRRPPAPAGRNRLTGRATALFVVLALLAVAYTWPVKEYLRQRSELGRLRADDGRDAGQGRRAPGAEAAAGPTRRTSQAQARERLHFVLPGETAYVVLQPDHPAAPPHAAEADGTGAARVVRPAVGQRAGRRRGRDALSGRHWTAWRAAATARSRTGARPGLDARDLAAVAAQLGREPRGVVGVAHRCPCGLPDVVRTAPRLPDGTPFPTLYYLTCPRAVSAVGTLESTGTMREMTERLGADPELAAAYRDAHEDVPRRA